MARKYYIEDGENIPAIVFDETAPAGFSLITEVAKLKDLHAQRYHLQRIDGEAYFESFQASLYLKIVDATYTVAEVVALESHIEPISKEISKGSWLTAQAVITTFPLSGIFNAAFRTEIKTDIDTYVTDNY